MICSIGYGNSVMVDKVEAIIVTGSSPVRQLIEKKKSENKCLDATHNRKTRSLVYLSSGSIVLCAVDPYTLQARLDNREPPEKKPEKTTKVRAAK